MYIFVLIQVLERVKIKQIYFWFRNREMQKKEQKRIQDNKVESVKNISQKVQNNSHKQPSKESEKQILLDEQQDKVIDSEKKSDPSSQQQLKPSGKVTPSSITPHQPIQHSLTPQTDNNLTALTPAQQKKFIIQFNNYQFTFALANQQFTVTGQKQLNRQYLHQSFTYDNFTQQMKALFQNTQDIWTILQSSRQDLQFIDEKLYFKIFLGGKEKKIHIPLGEKEFTDLQYIQQLEKVANKYIQLSRNLQQQLEQRNEKCNCATKTLKEQKKKQFTLPQDFNLSTGRSHASSNNWPQPPENFCFDQQDPLVLFEQLIQKLSKIREHFQSYKKQIQSRIQNRSGLKIVLVKFLSLQKKKKDYFLQMQDERKKFIQFKCKNDIDHQIDQLKQWIFQNYQQLQARINLMKEDK